MQKNTAKSDVPTLEWGRQWLKTQVKDRKLFVNLRSSARIYLVNVSVELGFLLYGFMAQVVCFYKATSFRIFPSRVCTLMVPES